MSTQNTVWLKKIEKDDLINLWNISYGPQADLEWMKYNGPYFNDPIQTWEEFSSGFGNFIIDNPMFHLVMLEEKMVGIVTAYWDDGKLKQWLEIGIVLYDSSVWGKGIGSQALRLWLPKMFQLFPYLPHISFTTWSGNPGMIRTGEKIGMKQEGVIRKVRYLNGTYYDSVKFGILREELETT